MKEEEERRERRKEEKEGRNEFHRKGGRENDYSDRLGIGIYDL